MNQNTSIKMIKIGEVFFNLNGNVTFSYVRSVNSTTLWQGLQPFDGIPLTRIVEVDRRVTVVFIILASVGIFFSVSCLIFNTVFTKSKLIRLASPKLNYLIIAGSFLLYTTMIVSVIPSSNKVKYTDLICSVTSWFSSIGYSLCFGTMIMKMVRIFYIFRNPHHRKKIIKDWMLALAVFFMVILDIFLLLSYTVSQVTASKGIHQAKTTPSLEHYQDIHGPQNIVTDNFVYACDSIYYLVFFGIIFGYKVILQIISLILALYIRKVKIKGVNDAKYIAAAAYVVSIILVVLILAIYLLESYINISTIIFCTGYFVGTTTVLGLVFLPLMVRLYKDPKGEKLFEHSTVATTSCVNRKSTSNLFGQVDDCDALKKRITKLQLELDAIRSTNVEQKNEGSQLTENGEKNASEFNHQ